MEKGFRIKLSGLAEQFINELKLQGLTEEDIFAQALGILAEVWRTNAVAKIKPGHRDYEVEAVEFYYSIQTPQNFKRPAEGTEGTALAAANPA